jgi:hypothetical protein
MCRKVITFEKNYSQVTSKIGIQNNIGDWVYYDKI